MFADNDLRTMSAPSRRRRPWLLALIPAGLVAGGALSTPSAASEHDTPQPELFDTLVADCLRNSAGTADAAERWASHCRDEALAELSFRNCMASVPRTADAAERWVPWCRDVVDNETGPTL
jgi:hypothetical protein